MESESTLLVAHGDWGGGWGPSRLSRTATPRPPPAPALAVPRTSGIMVNVCELSNNMCADW
jgi:hypothetical protein